MGHPVYTHARTHARTHAHVLPIQKTQLTKQFIQPGWALSLSFYVFRLHCFCMIVIVLFYLGDQLSHVPSCFGSGVTKSNEPSSNFLLPPHYCGLGAGFIP